MATYAVQTPVHQSVQLTTVTPVTGDLAPTGPANSVSYTHLTLPTTPYV